MKKSWENGDNYRYRLTLIDWTAFSCKEQLSWIFPLIPHGVTSDFTAFHSLQDVQRVFACVFTYRKHDHFIKTDSGILFPAPVFSSPVQNSITS